MSGRQFFSNAEKYCLQELVVKYKLHTRETAGSGNPALKKIAWARLTEEYNSIETNTRRTESQLKKCWDNLKTRKKQALALEKRERMKTGGGPPPSTSSQDDVEAALLEATDVELMFAIDSDMVVEECDNQEEPTESSGVALQSTVGGQSEERFDLRLKQNFCLSLYVLANFGNGWKDFNRIFSDQVLALPSSSGQLQATVRQETSGVQSATARARTTSRRSGSRLSDYDAASSQTSVAKNVRARVIHEEFALREQNYKRSEEREETLHKLKVAEREWLVKAAEEQFKKSVLERQSAEEQLQYNIAKRKAAELTLAELKRN